MIYIPGDLILWELDGDYIEAGEKFLRQRDAIYEDYHRRVRWGRARNDPNWLYHYQCARMIEMDDLMLQHSRELEDLSRAIVRHLEDHALVIWLLVLNQQN